MSESNREIIHQQILDHLTVDDDADCWRAVIEHVLPEAEFLCCGNPESKVVVLKIGSCSRWLRPHQTRWKADGGFAWPSGYQGRPYSRCGLPHHDWELIFGWNSKTNIWQERDSSKRIRRHQLLEFRVSIPARTSRHDQAAVCTIWSPGAPPLPKDRLVQFYGFRKREIGWEWTASSGSSRAYNTVSDMAHS